MFRGELPRAHKVELLPGNATVSGELPSAHTVELSPGNDVTVFRGAPIFQSFGRAIPDNAIGFRALPTSDEVELIPVRTTGS